MQFRPFQLIQGGRPAAEAPRPGQILSPGQSRTNRPDAPDSPSDVPDTEIILALPQDVEEQMKAIWGPDSAGQGPADPEEFWAKYGHMFLR